MNARLIHLVRHGPPRSAGLLLGQSDEAPADPSGGLRDAVPEALPISHVWSSDLQRARVGAEAIARSRSIGLSMDPRWRELDFGEWEGLSADDVPREGLTRFWDDPDASPPPGGERWSALQARIRAALVDLDDMGLVVTHGGAMRAAVAVLTGLDHRQVWAFDLPYGALLSLRIWPGAEPAGQIIGLRAGCPS
ncbi:histidine phosphatase family protein [Novosphingobium sp.]|uniref:histidine phosphatase family protein n=1 Tax=Novosphingobium sp. TaxID=1874826 RepID=UPI0038B812EA|nr:histidine phosphatase family protein [Pseudomonadota bacterium]